VDEMLIKWEEENLTSLQERIEKVFKKKEKEYDDAEQRDPKLKYNEAFQTERQDELRKLREKLKDQRKSDEDMIKGRKEEFELHNQALKEIDTMIIYHKIKFVEDIYNVFGGESFFSSSSSSNPRIFIPNFSRVFGPFFTSEKIQMNMTASVFFTIVEPFKLIRNVGFERAMLVLVSKLASSLRSTISRLTLSEIFEERQKLMEMLRRELDDVAEDWGVEIKSVAIEEIFLEDPAFQRILDDRREMELYGEKRIEQKRTEGSQILIQGRQQAERVVMESQAEKEREINRIHQAIERARVELDTRKIEAETLLKEKQYEAERALISVQAEVAEIALKSQALTPNILKRELIRNLPDIIEKMTNSMQTAILSPQQYLQLITGQMIYDAIEGGLSKMQAEVSDGKGTSEGHSKEVLSNIVGIPGIQNFDPSKSSIIANINSLLDSIQGNLDPDNKSNEKVIKKSKGTGKDNTED
jgi:regulator of protease activity HflC (stomatin/prohibitin superfamily)